MSLKKLKKVSKLNLKMQLQNILHSLFLGNIKTHEAERKIWGLVLDAMILAKKEGKKEGQKDKNECRVCKNESLTVDEIKHGGLCVNCRGL